MLASIIATTATGKQFSADDFNPFAEVKPEPVVERPWEEMLLIVEGMNKSMRGKDLRKSTT